MNYIPYVVDQKNERGYDIFSRLLMIESLC